MNLLIDSRPALVPLVQACNTLAINRSTLYWRRRRRELSDEQKLAKLSRKHCIQSRALSETERSRLSTLFNNEEFVDQPPVEIYHALLERGENLCSISTMHRILRKNKQNGERLDGWHRDLVSLLYGTGMRIMEALTLRVKDVDFQYERIQVCQAKRQKGSLRTITTQFISRPEGSN